MFESLFEKIVTVPEKWCCSRRAESSHAYPSLRNRVLWQWPVAQLAFSRRSWLALTSPMYLQARRWIHVYSIYMLLVIHSYIYRHAHWVNHALSRNFVLCVLWRHRYHWSSVNYRVSYCRYSLSRCFKIQMRDFYASRTLWNNDILKRLMDTKRIRPISETHNT